MHKAHNKSIFAFWNFPDKVKIAKVTPIHKKGERKVIKNYRPISTELAALEVIDRLLNQLNKQKNTN